MMTINKREKILAATTAILLALVAGWFLLGYLGGSLAQDRAQNDQLKKEVEEKQLEVKKAAKAYELLTDWNRRCLPSNIQAASSEYQNWLMELCEDVNLSGRKVDIITQRTEISGWTRLLFSIHGRGTLEQLTNLLDQVYKADHLQQIVSLTVKPVDEGSKTLDLTIAIEAVSLPGAVDAEGGRRSDQLYQAPQEQVADVGDDSDDSGKESDEPAGQETLDDHLDAIVARNMFMPYSPPPPPPVELEQKPEPPKPPGFDHLKYTVVTAIVEVNDQRQVWILTRTTGKLHKLVKGQSFQLGEEDDPARATIGTITPREVEVISEHDGRQYMVALGDNLQPPPAPDSEDQPADTDDEPTDADDEPTDTDDEPTGSM
jgi:hypothetical protein